jgi:Protein of unknown function (DUF3300)
MRKVLTVSLAICLGYAPALVSAAKPEALPAAVLPQDESSYVPYSPDQLDNLLAPIALYPDPLLAQVLVAATFEDEIDDAARYVRAYGQNGIEDQPWDVSIKAVAHYPQVLDRMDEDLDWTTALGQAYVYQSSDVMASIQRLRAMAYNQGNLVSGPQWQIVNEPGYIEIWPASPQYIYVPAYEPAVYYQRAYPDIYVGFISFGTGFPIGAWLNRDCDWDRHRVFYTGWQGRGWIERSRPYVHITNVYVNNRYTNVTVNRTVVNRTVNVSNINRYNGVHREVTFNNAGRAQTAAPERNPVNNRVIDRNINTGNPRLDQFRGRASQPAPPRAAPQTYRPAPEPAARPPQVSPAPTPPRPYRPAEQPRARPQAPPAPALSPRAFGPSEGTFSPRVASQRGQASRQAASRPAPQARPAPSREGAPQAAPSRSAPNHPGRPPGRQP